MTSMFLYWIIKLSSIKSLFSCLCGLFGTFSIIGFIVFIISKCYHGSYDIKTNELYGKEAHNSKMIKDMFLLIFKVSSILWVVSLLINTFLPSTEEMAVIYVIPKIVNNESIQQIPEKLLNLANSWLNEITPEKLLK